MDYKNAASDNTIVIKLKGEVLADESLIGLQNQCKGIIAGQTLVIEIASPGGSVAEGLLIMKWLNELSEVGVRIVTVVTANAYSIASLIMLAADIKLISRHAKVMVHNPMVPELSYVNANELEKHITSLRELEGFMYQLYQMFTGLEEGRIRELMDNETYLSPQEAVHLGFADMVININEEPYEMANKPDKQVNMSKTVNVLKQIIAKIDNAKFVNQLYYDNEGSAVEIYQADPSQYQIGDRTSIEDGEVKLADGSKLILKGGIIEDIVKGEVAPQEPIAPETAEEVVGDPMAQDGSLGDLNTPAVVEDIIEDPMAGEFNTGPAPVQPTIEPKSKDEMPSQVVEKTESTVTTKETVAQAEDPMAQAEPKEALASPGATPVVVEEEMVTKADFEALKAKYDALEAKVEMIANTADVKSVENEKFKETTAEAIGVLAKNTVSGFVPEARFAAKASTTPTGKNSIFQNLKRQAGLA